MITAKRNKEGVVEISGLIDNRQYFINVDDNVLYVSDVEGCKIVKIEDEKESEPFYMGFNKTELDKIHKFIMNGGVEKNNILEPKFIPTHEELLEWGFEPKTLLRNPPIDIYEKESGYCYHKANNELTEFGYDLPFHTKQDFMRIVGVDETFGDKLSDIDLKLCKLKGEILTMLSDAKIELTKKILGREK